jgi:pimeloyl-ACP methyl ester carboxylesterase
MATFAFIPGAGSDGWFWHRVRPRLEAAGHEVVTPDLPLDDDTAGLAEYADVVADAIGDRTGVVLVAQSMGGFTAPLVCDRVPVSVLVYLNAMIPLAGEAPGEWWGHTGSEAAFAALAAEQGRSTEGDFDLEGVFLHDLPADVKAELLARGESKQPARPFETPCSPDRWPDVPTRVLIGRDDRLFPAAFQRRVATERLGITPDEMAGGHLCALSNPDELARWLMAYAGAAA